MEAQRDIAAVAHNKILVVEDHAETAEMLRTLLEVEGYHVTWAKSAGIALELLTNTTPSRRAGAPEPTCPDVMLLDLTLPDMTPADMLQRLSDTGHQAPPVVLMSAQPPSDVRAAAESLHAAAVVHKPFPVDEMLHAIEGILAGGESALER
jgi:CheY-like chemotaxis protein